MASFAKYKYLCDPHDLYEGALVRVTTDEDEKFIGHVRKIGNWWTVCDEDIDNEPKSDVTLFLVYVPTQRVAMAIKNIEVGSIRADDIHPWWPVEFTTVPPSDNIMPPTSTATLESTSKPLTDDEGTNTSTDTEKPSNDRTDTLTAQSVSDALARLVAHGDMAPAVAEAVRNSLNITEPGKVRFEATVTVTYQVTMTHEVSTSVGDIDKDYVTDSFNPYNDQPLPLDEDWTDIEITDRSSIECTYIEPLSNESE